MNLTAFRKNFPMRRFYRTQTMKVMRLTAILLLAGCLQVSAKGFSQKITLRETNASLEKVFKEIKKQTGYTFMYQSSLLSNARTVNIHVRDMSLQETLDICFKDQPYTYKIFEKIIAVKTKEISMLEPTVSYTSPPLQDVSGTVEDMDGNPLYGASVNIRGSRRNTVTDANGKFILKQVDSKSVLIISFIGYKTAEIVIGGSAFINVKMEMSTSQQLNEVVVTTALGIQRKSKDLTYATQKLNNADFTTVKDANFINSLTGKVAGVTITRSASGLGGSARVILRGNKSTRENQPLYVIDGIPLVNFSPVQPGDVWGQTTNTLSGAQSSASAGRDGGDGISNINPDDIESITVLKGASGAALYGSAAANGAIVITTKTGKAGKTRITVSSEVTIDKPLYYPELQFKYSQGLNGVAPSSTSAEDSWGPVINAPNHVKPFFNTGVTTANSVSLSAGTEKAQTYFSYANTHSTGLEPTSSLNKNNLNFRETAKFLNDRLLVDANLSFLEQTTNNRPVSGLYANPLTGLYLFPRGLDFNKYKTNYQYFSPVRNMNLQNWFDINYDQGLTGQDHEQNPYWLLNNAPRTDKRDRAFGNVSLKYKINEWLNIQARGNFDKSFDTYDSRMFAGTQSIEAAPNGRYSYDKTTNSQLYGDLILTANKNISKNIVLQANLGTSIIDSKIEDISFDTDPNTTDGLFYANKFGVDNIAQDALISSQSFAHKQQQAVFASAQLRYKNFLYLDLTGRNDWSSTFAFTPTKSSGYFYYSAGLNLILSDAFTMPAAISFGKIRVSYAKVGNDVPVYITNPAPYTMSNTIAQPSALTNTKVPLPGSYLRPEDNRSFEAGTEWRFAKDKVGIDITYYKNNNFRQYMEVNAPLGSGYSKYYLNLGNIQNTGVEAIAYVTPVATKKFNWTSTFNFATNSNKVVKLSDASVPGAGPNNLFYLTAVSVNSYQLVIKEGGQWGDIYGTTFSKAKDGSILVDNTGKPISDGTFSKVGNPNPTFTLGWNNSFDINNFTVSFLVDGRFGGHVMSLTQAVLDEYGDSKASADARDAGGVNRKATISDPGQADDGKAWSGLLPAQVFYKGSGNRNGITENYMYSATAIRLREFAIGYKIPIHAKGIIDLKFSLIARNLFFLSKKAPFDPEISMATNNGLQGIENFSVPATRSLGASLKIGF